MTKILDVDKKRAEVFFEPSTNSQRFTRCAEHFAAHRQAAYAEIIQAIRNWAENANPGFTPGRAQVIEQLINELAQRFGVEETK